MDSDSSCEPLSENVGLLSDANVSFGPLVLPGRGNDLGRDAGAVSKAKAVVGKLSRAIAYNVPFENENFSVHSSPTSSSLCSEIQDSSSRIERPEEIARRRMKKAMSKYNNRLEILHREVESLEAKKRNLQDQVERLRDVDRREKHLETEFRLMEEREAGLRVKQKALEDKLELAERSKNEVLKYWETQSSLQDRDERITAREKELEARARELEQQEARAAEASKRATEIYQLQTDTESLHRELTEREDRVTGREEQVANLEKRLESVIAREKALAQARVDKAEISRQQAVQKELQRQLDADTCELSDKAERLSKREKEVANRIAHAEQLKANLEIVMAETREQLNQNEEKKRELSERAGIMERDKSELSRQYTELEQERTQFEREMKYRTDQWESVRNKDREGLERLKLQSVKAQAEIESARREIESRENRIVSREKEVQSFKLNQVSLREEEFKLDTRRAELDKEAELLRAESRRLETERKRLDDLRVEASEAKSALEQQEKQIQESRLESLELLRSQLDKRANSLDQRERAVREEEHEIVQAKQARQNMKKLKKACEKEIRRAKEETTKSQEAKKKADELQRSLSAFEKELKEREIRIQAYEQRMEDVERKEEKVSSAQLQHERASLKIREKEKQLVQKEQLLDQQREQLEGVEADRRTEWKRQMSILSQSAQTTKLEKEDLKRRWDEVERKEAALASEAEEQRALRSKIGDERKKIDDMMQEFSAEKDALNRAKQALQRSQSEFSDQVRAWQDEQAALQKEAQEVMEAVRRERTDLETEKARVNTEASLDTSQRQAKVQSLHEESRRLEVTINSLRTAKEEALADIERAQLKTSRTVTECDKKQEELKQAESRLVEASRKLESVRSKTRAESKELQLLKSRIEKIREYEREFERRAEDKAAGLSKRQTRVRAMEAKLQTAAEAVKLRARKVAKQERQLADVKQQLQTCLPSQSKQKRKLEIKLRVPPTNVAPRSLKPNRASQKEDVACDAGEERKVMVQDNIKEASCNHEKLMELFQEMSLAQREEFTKLKRDLEQRNDEQQAEQTMHALVEELLQAKGLAEEGMMKSAASMREDILEKLREMEHKHEEKYESMAKKWENALDEIQRNTKVGHSSDNPEEPVKALSEQPTIPLQETSKIPCKPLVTSDESKEDIEAKSEQEQKQIHQRPSNPPADSIHAPIEQLQTVTPLLAQRSKEARECLALAIVAQENVSFSKIDSILKQVEEPSNHPSDSSDAPKPRSPTHEKKQDSEVDRATTTREEPKELDEKLEEDKAHEFEKMQKLEAEERKTFEKQLKLVHECDTRLQAVTRSLESVKGRLERLEKIVTRRDTRSSMGELGKACQEAETELCNARFFVRDVGNRLRNGLKHLDELVLQRMIEQVDRTEKFHLRLEEELQAQILRGHAIMETQGATAKPQLVDDPPSRRDENVSVEVLAAENEIACSLQTLEETIRARDKILERAKEDEISTLSDTDASGLYGNQTKTGMSRISEEIHGEEDSLKGEVLDEESEHSVEEDESDREDSFSSSLPATDMGNSEDNGYSAEVADSNAPDDPSLEITQRSESALVHTEGSFVFAELGSSVSMKPPVQSLQFGPTSAEGEIDSERARKILRLQELSVELALASDEEEAELLQKEFDALQESLGGESFTANLNALRSLDRYSSSPTDLQLLL